MQRKREVSSKGENVDMIELKYGKGEVEITAYQEERTGQLFLTLDGLAALFGKDRSNLAKQAKAIAGQSWQSWQNFAMIPSGERRYRKAVYGLDVIRSIAESRGSEEGLSFCRWAASLARPSGGNALEKSEFIEGNSKIEVLVSPEEETVWLAQEQIAELFETSRTNVVEHIQNIYSQEEVGRSSTCRFFRQVASNGKRYNMPFYNLDMVLAIGYRVNSKRGIAFRKWASSVLKEKLRKERAVPVEGVSSAFETNVMRLISSFAPPKEQVASLQQAVIHLDNRVSETEKRLGNWSEEHILYEGKPFMGMILLESIFKRAKHQIVWIDPYADEATLRFLSYCPSKQLPIRIYLGNPKQFDVTKADDFKAQYQGPIEVFHASSIHDRCLIIDGEEAYMIGQSANGIGKDSSGMMIRIKTKEVIDFLLLDAERKTKERIYPPKSDD